MIPDKEFNEIWNKYTESHPDWLDESTKNFELFYMKFMWYAIGYDDLYFGGKAVSESQRKFISHVNVYGESPLETFMKENKEK